MRRFSPFLPLLAACLLAGCGSRSEPAFNDAPVEIPNEIVPAGLSEAQLRERAIQALGQILRDPSAAQLSDLRSGSGGAVCGTIDLQQGPAALRGARPFIVPPTGEPMLSTATRVDLRDAADPFADAYLRWCATPDELRVMQDSIVNYTAPNSFVPIPEIPEPAATPAAPQEPARWREPAAPQDSGPGDDSSFQNAVRRGPR